MLYPRFGALPKKERPKVMKNLSIRALIAAVSLALAPAAFAGSYTGGTVSKVHYSQTGIILVTLTGASHVSPPACAVVTSRFSIDPSTAAGAAQLNGVLHAAAMGKTLDIQGTGACGSWSDTEGTYTVTETI